MTYSTSNPPVKIAGSVGSHSLWLYVSTDAHTAVDASSYFSNGEALGIKANDAMIVIDSSTPTATIHNVASVDTAATITSATLS